MKKFTQKNYGKRENIALGISATGLGISAANFATNLKRRKSDKDYQEKQLKAMDKLTNSLNKVDNSLKKLPEEKKETKKRGFKFLQKNHSHTGDLAFKGAVYGGAVAGGAIPFLPEGFGDKKTTFVNTEEKSNGGEKGHSTFEQTKTSQETTEYTGVKNKFALKYNKLSPFYKKALIEVGGMAIGATLGALVGMVMDASEAINRKTTVNNRLLKNTLESLKKMGFKEGQHYTRDPKISNLLKTKVCLVVSKSSDELRLLINTVNDSKLKTITGQITKNLPTMSTVSEKVSDRYNELNITTMTSNNGDAIWVATVAEKFIKAGYPVYLVEVG